MRTIPFARTAPRIPRIIRVARLGRLVRLRRPIGARVIRIQLRARIVGIRLRPRSVGIGPVRVGLTWVRIVGVRVVGVRIGLRARVVGVRIVGVGLLFHGKRARLHGCSKIRVRNTSANDILARGRTLGRLARIRHLDAICISSAYETRRERRVRFAFHALSVIHRHKQLGGRNRNCELNGFGLKIVARFGRVCNHTCRSRSIDSRVAALKRDGGSQIRLRIARFQTSRAFSPRYRTQCPRRRRHPNRKSFP